MLYGFILRDTYLLRHVIEEGGLVRPVRFPYPEKNQETRIELPKDRSLWTSEGLGMSVEQYPVRHREDDCLLVFRYILLDSAKNQVCTLLPVGATGDDPVLDARELDSADFLSIDLSSQEDPFGFISVGNFGRTHDHDLFVWEGEGGLLSHPHS